MQTPRISPQAGFTLMEMIISLVVLGLLSVVMLPLLSLPITAYMDAQRRVELQAQLSLAESKIKDDLQYAMPGSVRWRLSGNSRFLEYLEVRAVARYRNGAGGAAFCPAATGSPACAAIDANSLATGAACLESCFTTLGPLSPANAAVVPNSDYIAIMVPGANPYAAGPVSAMSRVTVAPVYFPGAPAAAQWVGLRFTPVRFPPPIPSPPSAPAPDVSNRVYIVSQPVTYVCNQTTGQLTKYWGYAVQINQPIAFAAGTPSVLLANTVSQCDIRVQNTPASLQQVASIKLRLARNTASQPADTVDGFIEVGIREP